MDIGYINDGGHLIKKQFTSTLQDIIYMIMKTIPALTNPSKKTENTVLFTPSMAKKKRRRDNGSSHGGNLKSTRKPYYKFYKVFKNQTSVTEILINDFKIFQPAYIKIKIACALHSWQRRAFSLPADDAMFYGFISRIRAMEFAKAKALKYISKLIDEGEEGYSLLLKYREDHYEDLNVNLTDSNIRKIEWELAEI
jgi:hypothetical protein